MLQGHDIIRAAKRLVVASALVIASAAFALPIGSEGDMGAEICGNCHTATLFGASSHDFHSCSGGSHQAAPNTCHEDDMAGTCGEYHYVCSVEELDLATVAGAARGEIEMDVEELAAMGSVSFQPDRNALQVTDCDGHIIAHFPITRGLN